MTDTRKVVIVRLTTPTDWQPTTTAVYGPFIGDDPAQADLCSVAGDVAAHVGVMELRGWVAGMVPRRSRDVRRRAAQDPPEAS